jgi:photosystem II reaction center protein PsbM
VHLPTSGASPGLDPPLTVSLSTLVVAVDGGTIGLDVSFGAFLAVILGLFIPVVFLVTLYIQSEAQGTATSFREVAAPFPRCRTMPSYSPSPQRAAPVARPLQHPAAPTASTPVATPLPRRTRSAASSSTTPPTTRTAARSRCGQCELEVCVVSVRRLCRERPVRETVREGEGAVSDVLAPFIFVLALTNMM